MYHDVNFLVQKLLTFASKFDDFLSNLSCALDVNIRLGSRLSCAQKLGKNQRHTTRSESESELFTGDTSKDNHSPGPVFREVSP